MVSVAPAFAVAGVTLVALLTKNVCGEIAVPSGVTTVIVPLVNPFGTVAVICVAAGVNVSWLNVPNFTEVASASSPPVMVTEVAPAAPSVGVNEVITGSGVKDAGLDAESAPLWTVTTPGVASIGTTALTVAVVGVPDTATPL